MLIYNTYMYVATYVCITYVYTRIPYHIRKYIIISYMYVLMCVQYVHTKACKHTIYVYIQMYRYLYILMTNDDYNYLVGYI